MKMKVSSVLLIIIVCCLLTKYSRAGGMDDLPADVKQMLKNLRDNCIGESGATEDMVAGPMKGDFRDEKNLKCYMKCLLTSIGVMDDDGVMDWETYEGLLPDFMLEYGKKVVAKCSSIEPLGDACETAFLINKCSYEVDPKQYVLF